MSTKLFMPEAVGIDLHQEVKLFFTGKLFANAAKCFGSNAKIGGKHVLRHTWAPVQLFSSVMVHRAVIYRNLQ